MTTDDRPTDPADLPRAQAGPAPGPTAGRDDHDQEGAGEERRGPGRLVLGIVVAALLVCCCSAALGLALSISANLFHPR